MTIMNQVNIILFSTSLSCGINTKLTPSGDRQHDIIGLPSEQGLVSQCFNDALGSHRADSLIYEAMLNTKRRFNFI